MTLQDRIDESKRNFENKQTERSRYLEAADECLEEMHRFQGEYRALCALLEEEESKKGDEKPQKEK